MWIFYLIAGFVIGVLASFAGLGGGFLLVPFLLILGKAHPQAVGTSMLAILLISLSSVIAHGKLHHVDFLVGFLLAIGGAVGAQLGARFVEMVPTQTFQKSFAIILFSLAVYLFFRRP